MINRLAGVVFNVIKVAFILSIILSIFNTINRYGEMVPEEDRIESLLYEPVSSFAPAVFPYLKFEDIQQRFRK
jgi:membrane protein required for colicin V production